MLCVFILFCLLAGVLAQDPKTEQCPAVKSAKFDLHNLVGDWYEYKRSRNIVYKDLKCVRITLAESQSNEFDLEFKFRIKSTGQDSTLRADINVSDKKVGFTVDLPIIGQTYKPVTILAVDSDFIVIYSCERRASRRIEKAMVITSSLSKPSQSLDQRIRQAFADHGVKMPEMNTNDLEDCGKVNSNNSVQLPETPQTPEELSLACFFSPSCITAKVHEIVSSFLP